MNVWKTCMLGDILTFQRGHDLPKSKMMPGAYPVVGSNGIIGYHNKYTTEAPAITIGRSGNTGNPFIVYGQSWSHNTTLYVKEFKDSDPVFMYYLLKTLDLGNFAGGSAVPTLNRNHIHTLELTVPPLEEQIEIGRTLQLLDDKIATNSRINHHLPARSATDSSPDIRRGKRAPRKAARQADSFKLLSMVAYIGSTVCSKSLISSTGGTATLSPSKSLVTIASKTAPLALCFKWLIVSRAR